MNNPSLFAEPTKMYASDFDPKIRALVHYLRDNGNKISYEEVEEVTWSDDNFEANGCEYMVLTDDEADQKWDEYLDSYLDECVLPELPESAQHYFDRESWKYDARMDGRGHSLSSYDGCEYDAEADGETYYIYRTN